MKISKTHFFAIFDDFFHFWKFLKFSKILRGPLFKVLADDKRPYLRGPLFRGPLKFFKRPLILRCLQMTRANTLPKFYYYEKFDVLKSHYNLQCTTWQTSNIKMNFNVETFGTLMRLCSLSNITIALGLSMEEKSTPPN